MIDPVLVEVRRGPLAESEHRGIVCVADAAGGIALALGDIDRPVFPRSAVKALQALPLVETGAADAFGLTDAELALACASHNGEPAHVAVASAMLARAGLAEDALVCGAHWPMHAGAARDLAARGGRPAALHNNCSGKHAGFLCLACHERIDPAGYVRPDHPVQRMVTDAVAGMTGFACGPANRAVDGCSIPTHAIPMRHLAQAFASFGSGEGLGIERARACARIRRACAAEPAMVAGDGRFDSEIMARFGARAFVKTGAEGVYCGALPEQGLGFALKCDDGATRASEVVAAAILARFLPLDDAARTALDRYVRPALSNWVGTRTGELRPVASLVSD